MQVARSKRQYDTGIQNMNASYTAVRNISREVIYTEPMSGEAQSQADPFTSMELQSFIAKLCTKVSSTRDSLLAATDF